MLRGLYTAASGMMANMVSTDTVANNLANSATTGFKRNNVNFQAFSEMMIQKQTALQEKSTPIGTLDMGVQVASTAIDFSQGTLLQTGNPLDLGIQGDGFFTVKNAQGETAYTRNGSFTLNGQGFLCTMDGHLVQGEAGNIQIPPGGTISISEGGQISVGQQVVGKLAVARFQSNHQLEKIGDSLFKATPNAQPLAAAANSATPLPILKVEQGTLEGSNVNPVMELINSISGLRLYETLQKNIHMHNETLGKAVNDVGRFKA